jgi:hypothetical protein
LEDQPASWLSGGLDHYWPTKAVRERREEPGQPDTYSGFHRSQYYTHIHTHHTHTNTFRNPINQIYKFIYFSNAR